MTRRTFIGRTLSCGALFAASRLPAFADTSAGDGVIRIGVISDTHVTGPESAERLAEALEFFARRRVDAVVHCGDIADLGYVAQLDVFASVWRRTMPAGVPLVAAFGNRDMSDTSKMPEERREADRVRLILADPAAAMKRVCGWSGEFGVRALEVKGVALVAADWRHEGELEKFLSTRPDLRKTGRVARLASSSSRSGTSAISALGSAATRMSRRRTLPRARQSTGASWTRFS